MQQGKGMKYSLTILFIVFNLLDWLITCNIILHGGIEVMPIAWYIIENYGLLGLLLFKMLTTIIVVSLLHKFKFDRLLLHLNIIMAIICLWGIVAELIIFYSA